MKKEVILVMGITLLFIFSAVNTMALLHTSEINSIEENFESVNSDDNTLELKTLPTKAKTKSLNEMSRNEYYTHTVLVEVATSQACGPCHGMNYNLYNYYTSGDYDFEFVEMIYADHDGQILNNKAWSWALSYYVWQIPTCIFDGNYRSLIGNHPSELPGKFDDCGNRIVHDISAELNVLWLGNGKIKVDISIQNNEDVEYEGLVQACITEITSRYDTSQGSPYHFGFLDYAIRKTITIGPGEIYTSSAVWDGNEHQDNHGNDFGDIAKNNIRVIMGVFNSDNDYVDVTVAANAIGDNFPPNTPNQPSPPDGSENVDIDSGLSWSCSDPDGEPLTYDVYFGTSSSPPLVSSGQSENVYNSDQLEKDKTYYWKIVAFDNNSASTSSPIWSFDTKIKNKNNVPQVNITKPKRAIYLNNVEILPRYFFPPLIIGNITIQVTATDEDSGIAKVEFYINNKLTSIDTTTPYTYNWGKSKTPFNYIYWIKVIAYSNDGEQADKMMIVLKYL